MKIHEYQAKQLLAESGVPVPKGIVARTADDAARAFTELGTPLAVVKSQIHAGGRGKGTFKEQPQQLGFRHPQRPRVAASPERRDRILASTTTAVPIASMQQVDGSGAACSRASTWMLPIA